jgi:hypothetical protein
MKSSIALGGRKILLGPMASNPALVARITLVMSKQKRKLAIGARPGVVIMPQVA